jgi:hypothetical protein
MLFDPTLPVEDKRRLAFLRVRDTAFDAVTALWRLRKTQGMSQKDIGDALSRDPAWVSRNLAGPANWTMKTFGEFVEALDGYATISVVPKENVPAGNFDIYSDAEDDTAVLEPIGITIVQKPKGNVVVTVQAPSVPVAADKVLAYAG